MSPPDEHQMSLAGEGLLYSEVLCLEGGRGPCILRSSASWVMVT